MKKIILTSMMLAALAAMAGSCQKEIENTPVEDVNTVNVVFTANAENDGTKATIQDNETSGKFLWAEADEIAVSTGVKTYKAVLTGEAGKPSADFALTESLGAGETPAFAAFPYGAAAGTVSYPAVYDNYVSGTVTGPMLAVMPAEADLADGVVNYGDVTFKHVGGMIRVDVRYVTEGATSMVFTAKNDVVINGSAAVKAGLTEEEILDGSWRDGEWTGGTSTVTFNFPAVTEVGTMTFYVPVPAGVELTGGFNVTVKKGDKTIFSQDYTKAYTAKRARILKGVKAECNINLVETNGGRANCYIVDAGGRYRLVADYPDAGKTHKLVGITGADWLWSEGDESLVKNVAFAENSSSIYFEVPAGVKGNAVIAATNDAGEIVWSWHIWILCGMENPMEPTNYFRGDPWYLSDINLGATSKEVGNVDSYGLYYQWGRKDPFPASNTAGSIETSSESTAYESNTMGYVVNTDKFPEAQFSTTRNTNMGADDLVYITKNPMTNIHAYGVKEGNDLGRNTWGYNLGLAAFKALWPDNNVSTKSVYDPCPAGYRVPSHINCWTVGSGGSLVYESEGTLLNGIILKGKDLENNEVKSYYPAAGSRRSGKLTNVGSEGFYWTAQQYSGTYFYYMSVTSTAKNKVDRNLRSEYALSVRCMKM